MSKELAVKSSVSIGQYLTLDTVQKQIDDILGSRKQQFVTSLTALVNGDEKLQACSRPSILAAALTAAALDLPIEKNLGLAYIIPYEKNKKIEIPGKNGKSIMKWEKDQPVATFQMGYKGFRQLALRTGKYRFINATEIIADEFQGINRVTGEVMIKHLNEEEREGKEIVGFLSYFQLTEGFESYLYMSNKDLSEHGLKYSQSYKYSKKQNKKDSLWETDFESMALKTVTKLNLSRNGLITTELQKAITLDQSAITNDGEVEYPDNRKPSAAELAQRTEDERVLKHISIAKTVDELRQCEQALSGETRPNYEAKLKELEVEND
ncbi:MAG: recombinase RecT [Pseudomonadales bacterium]|jgi:recombination protein RecT|nr:recombinase RecT [Pseudomonadales bacterium]